MGELTVVRQSALHGHMQAGHYGAGDTGIVISECRELALWQLAVWPDSINAVAPEVARACGLDGVPGFGRVTGDSAAAMLRIEPLKFWLFGAAFSEDAVSGNRSEQAAALDLSHSRCHLHLTGAKATAVLNSFLPLDLRDESFPVNHVASSAMHHVGVTIWRSDAGYELFVPRGFAVSIWELLFETSLQYGLQVD